MPRRQVGGWSLLAVMVVTHCSVSPAQEKTAAGSAPWPGEIRGFVPVKSSEHPRLFFRQADIPKLRERAKTPEGQAIIKRLRAQLNGTDGETITSNNKWTISSVAGYGFLYVVTGDKKYAELGKECMEKQSFAGAKYWEDTRYAFNGPDGALRAGPSVGWGALGYDLCYDGWDEAYRKIVADKQTVGFENGRITLGVFDR